MCKVVGQTHHTINISLRTLLEKKILGGKLRSICKSNLASALHHRCMPRNNWLGRVDLTESRRNAQNSAATCLIKVNEPINHILDRGLNSPFVDCGLLRHGYSLPKRRRLDAESVPSRLWQIYTLYSGDSRGLEKVWGQIDGEKRCRERLSTVRTERTFRRLLAAGYGRCVTSPTLHPSSPPPTPLPLPSSAPWR
jgi:hypothetical protein